MSTHESPPALILRFWSTFEEVAALTSDWNRLAGGVPFRQWEWHASWWKHFGDHGQLFVVSVHRQDQCIGIAPFFLDRRHRLGNVLRLLGSGEVCSDYQSLLAEPADATSVGVAIAEWIARQPSDHDDVDSHHNESFTDVPAWDLIELDGLDAECPTIKAFIERLGAAGFAVHQSSRVNTWRVPIPATMPEYLASLSKPCRRKVRTALKRIERGECQVSFATCSDEFEQMWKTFIDLHQRRRNSVGDAGCFSSDRFSDFLFEAASSFFEIDQLDLASINIDGQPIAIEVCFRGETDTFAYQVGIDPNSLGENPGWLVNTASIQRAMSLKQSGFDLCRGDEEYKRRLGAQPKPCVDCRLVPPKLRSQLWDAAIVTGSTMKAWFKTSLTATGIR